MHRCEARVRLGKWQLCMMFSTYTRWKPWAVLGWSKAKLIAADWLWMFIQFGERRAR